MARESTRVTSHIESPFEVQMPGSECHVAANRRCQRRNEVRSEVADTNTGERAAISGSKLAFYGNVISDM
jgi:hypothetical protein